MAKLSRVFQKLFAGNAPTSEVGQFGSLAAGFPVETKDPADIQGLANFLDGWKGAIVGPNAPSIEDMNALFFLYAYQLCYVFQAGVPEWDTNTIYFIGSLVNSNGELFISIVDDNTGNPLTDTNSWNRYGSRLATYTANQALTSANEMVDADATAADITITLPAVTAAIKGKKITITKTDGAINPIYIAGAAIDYQLNAQYDSVTVYCNGTTWYAI